MPSDVSRTARRESVDWEALAAGEPLVSRRTVAFLVALAGLAGLFAYDYFLVVDTDEVTHATLGTWYASGQDWLVLFALLVFACFGVWPLAADHDRTRRYWRRLRRHPLGLASLACILAFVVVGIVGPYLVEHQVANLLRLYEPPVFTSVEAGPFGHCQGRLVGDTCHGSFRYPLGTDSLGRDVVVLVVEGARVSLLVAVIGAILVVPLATAVGVLSGYYGGRVDQLLMRYVDVQQAVPAIVAYVLLTPLFGESLYLLLMVFGLFSWGGIARLVRSETLQRRDDGYVLAARAAGANPVYVVRRHLVPNVSNTVLTATSQLVPLLLLTNAGLEFLGLSDQFLATWGETIAQGLHPQFAAFGGGVGFRTVMDTTFEERWWISAFPTAALTAVTVSFAVFGDVLRDVLDPRSAR